MSIPRPLQILLAVFDPAAAATLCGHLSRGGHSCQVAENLEHAEALLDKALIDTHAPGLLVIDLSLIKSANQPTHAPTHTIASDPLLQRVLAQGSPVVALSTPHPEIFFQAARLGVEAMLHLPLDPADYEPKLQAACARAQALLQPAGAAVDLTSPSPATISLPAPASGPASGPASRPEATTSPAHATLLSTRFALSADMAEVRDLIEKVAPTNATVLLKGESGVGKELAARLVHGRSLRSERAFIKVNCAAIPNDLLESELFGYEAGAFTGAIKGKPGKFELADGGTIFLDEIGELHPVLQAKLLNVLQDGGFARLGAKRDTAVDVRVICATNKQLDRLVASGQFREDLFYRINVVAVTLPPLRSRTREIPALIDLFLARYASTYGKPLVPIHPAAMQKLLEYRWPGNIRELENLCKRYVIVGGIEHILRDLNQREERRAFPLREQIVAPQAIEVPQSAPNLATADVSTTPSLLEIGRRAAWLAERAAIEKMLTETHWNRREAARRLGVSYKALLNKIALLESETESQELVLK